MRKSDLKIIVGGLSAPAPVRDRRFLSAFVTDTRLMGVVGMYANWELATRDGLSSFHQYFYFDAEEYGFETYKSVHGRDPGELAIIEQSLIGGLGGSKADLTEEEVCLLAQLFAEANHHMQLPLPGPKEEYAFLLDRPLPRRKALLPAVMEKMCGSISSEYQVINYFLMRCFARDFVAARFLADPSRDVPLELFPDFLPATLFKNNIKRIRGGGRGRFGCESLIEENGKYALLFTELELSALRITDYRRTTTLSISSQEAAMLLAQPEFITLYEIILEPEDFDELMAEATERSTATAHPNGMLYLAFHKNNDHVHKREYRLNDDVYGIYYVSDFGQVLVASYSSQGIRRLEEELRKSPLRHYLLEVERFEFKEPVLYEFVNSDFDDFEDFINAISEE